MDSTKRIFNEKKLVFVQKGAHFCNILEWDSWKKENLSKSWFSWQFTGKVNHERTIFFSKIERDSPCVESKIEKWILRYDTDQWTEMKHFSCDEHMQKSSNIAK